MKLENFKVLQNFKKHSLNKKYNRINTISMEFSRQKYCSVLPFPSPFTYAYVCVCVCVCKNAICDHPLELVGMCVCIHFIQSTAKNHKWDAPSNTIISLHWERDSSLPISFLQRYHNLHWRTGVGPELQMLLKRCLGGNTLKTVYNSIMMV